MILRQYRIILHVIADGPNMGCLTRKSLDCFAIFFFTFAFVFESELSTLLQMQKTSQIDWLFLVAGTGLEPVTFGL